MPRGTAVHLPPLPPEVLRPTVGAVPAVPGPTPDLSALGLATVDLTDAAPAGPTSTGRSAELPAGDVVAEVDAGRDRETRRLPNSRSRRPVLLLAAALVGISGVALVASTEMTAHASTSTSVGQATSVAEELGLLDAQQSTLSADEAAARLQEVAASRAVREDAEAAAAQVQAAADQAAADAAAAAAAAAAEAARPKVVVPVDGARLTSGFGARWGTLHAGVDFAAPVGTPEYAAMDGVVLRAGAASGYGLVVYIQHANGDVTVYGHMEEILVSEGQAVRAGETIALLGNRGRSTGPHLHFEVHRGGLEGTPVDPIAWLREHGAAL